MDTVIGGKSNRKNREVKALSLPVNEACSGGQPVALTFFGCVHGWTNTTSRSACSTLCCGRLFSCDGDRFDCCFVLGECLTWCKMLFVPSDYTSRGLKARTTDRVLLIRALPNSAAFLWGTRGLGRTVVGGGAEIARNILRTPDPKNDALRPNDSSRVPASSVA